MAFRLNCLIEFNKRLGEFDAIVEFTELSVRHFISSAEEKGDFKKYLTDQASKHHIIVNDVNQLIYRSRISQSYIISVYQSTELFLNNFIREHNELKEHNISKDFNKVDLLTGITRQLTKNYNSKSKIESFQFEVFDYYRLVRNKYSHPDLDHRDLDKKHNDLLKFADEIKGLNPKLNAPNKFDDMSFDDFLLFTSIVKNIAYDLVQLIKPTDDELKNYYLSKNKFTKLNDNLDRKNNALMGDMLSTFGIEGDQAKKIIDLLYH